MRNGALDEPTRSMVRIDRNDVALGLLSFASGSTDVLSFVVLSGVFTSAMTGNTALLGLALGQGQIATALRAVDALAGFLCGVAGATLLKGRRLSARPLAMVLAVEALCLAVFAIAWGIAGRSVYPEILWASIFVLATAMGIQSVAARIVDLPGIPTVVFTSTLTNVAMSVTAALTQRTAIGPETVRQIGVFCSYFTGALLAGALAPTHARGVALLPLVAVVTTLAVLPAPSGEPSV
jgi:uncharacterized membrane protein YoaK (UPF0700 family)